MNSERMLRFWRPRILNALRLVSLFVLAFTASAYADDYIYTTNFPDTNTITIISYIGSGGAVDKAGVRLAVRMVGMIVGGTAAGMMRTGQDRIDESAGVCQLGQHARLNGGEIRPLEQGTRDP